MNRAVVHLMQNEGKEIVLHCQQTQIMKLLEFLT